MIELKVEEYCHDCPEFEAKCNKDAFVFTNGRVHHCDTIITCEHAGRCASIKKYLANAEPKEESTPPGPIKTAELCLRCYYGVEGCKKCLECPIHIYGEGCSCCLVPDGKPCPYFKEANNEKT